jgi:integrase
MAIKKNVKRAPVDADLQEAVVLTRSSFDVHHIQTMEKDELLRVQKALGFGEQWGQWVVPEKWLSNKRLSDRTVSLDISEASASVRWLHVLRVLLAGSLTLGRNGRLLSPSTILGYGRHLCRLSVLCEKKGGYEDVWWSRAEASECLEVVKSATRNILSFFGNLYAGGLVADQPRSRPVDLGPGERDRFGDKEIAFDPDGTKTWQPLPDEFTSQFGKRVLWFMTILGPQILDCYEACIDLAHKNERAPGLRAIDELSAGSKRQTLGRLRTTLVREWDWRDANGAVLLNIPFQLNFRTRVNEPMTAKKNGLSVHETFTWPPRTWGDLGKLVALLQTCHAWLLMLASGPRNSTIVSYTIYSVKESLSGPRIEGLLKKSTQQWGGKKRDWPIPRKLVLAFDQQVRLCNAVRTLANPKDPESLGDNLWVQVGKGGKGKIGRPIYNFNASLDALVKAFGLRDLLGSEFPRLHTHRFRKTLARIIALALTSAQTVLMDALGHDDPDMTLGYMLSDRTIVADALQVQREMVILMAVDAISNSDAIGGPVGNRVREAKNRILRASGKSRLDPKDVYELADKETFGGRSWRQVMPGVICTVPHLDSGPCGEGKGVKTDPTNCQAGCRHQLLLAEHLNRSDENVADMLRTLERSIEEENEMMIAAVAPQIANEIYRWKLVYEKWCNHPLISQYCDLSNTPFWRGEECVA